MAEIKWDKLDNTAHLFPVIAGESMSNVYRISVTLKEDIRQEILQEALERVLPWFDVFRVRIRYGVFWYYFETNQKPAPDVKEEYRYPCQFISPNRNRNYMFRVNYYKNRINLEVFHVLTDGMGGNHVSERTDLPVSPSCPSGASGKNGGRPVQRHIPEPGGQLSEKLQKKPQKGLQDRAGLSGERGKIKTPAAWSYARIHAHSGAEKGVQRIRGIHQ